MIAASHGRASTTTAPPPLVANARMYAVNPKVAALWERLFAWVAVQSHVPLAVVAHPPPQPLAALWHRADLGCAFICGYPWSTWNAQTGARPRLLAAPRLSPARYGGRAVYCTDIVVRRDSPFADVDALRGARFAYTVEHSQSGWHAPRRFFAARAREAGGHWFDEAIGPLHTPRAVVDAVIAGAVDGGPLDSWWHDLLRRHDPAIARKLRTIASTPMAPIPPLVCAAATPRVQYEQLVAALSRVATERTLADLRTELLLQGFAPASGDDYVLLAQQAQDTDALGYPRLQ